MQPTVRTRFAPSPTGYMHVGNLRTALYAYLTAKSMGGQFILRIEDTDQNRYVDGATDVIFNTLRETGLLWDEGPDIGGPVGPYVQSQRMEIYKEHALQLVREGKAYYCFCGKTDLQELRANLGEEKAIDPCRELEPAEAQRRVDAGEPWVIRQKIPLTGETAFDDLVFGHISAPNLSLDDQILLKSDGMPTYNFANVIDDHLMQITHVIRGSEYLSSTPKYNLLYEAFGWEVPIYIHCAPVMKNQSEKLSKRNGDASYQDLVAKGYLTEAVLNYIALLGWSPGGERELYTLPQLVEAFHLQGISKSPAIFDPQKLLYINSEYIRALSAQRFHRLALPWIRQAVHNELYSTEKIAALLQARCEVLSDIPAKLDFFDALPEYEPALYVNKKMKTTGQTALEALTACLQVLENLSDFSADALHEALFGLIERLEVKNGWLLYPLRVAVSGKLSTPGGGIELCEILGKEETLRRLHKGIALLSAAQ